MRSFGRYGLVAVIALHVTACASQTVLYPAPDYSFRDLGDTLIRLQDFKGQQSVVLVFYVNSTCQPCLKHLRELEAQKAALAAVRATMVVVAVDGTAANARKVQRLLSLSYPVVFAPAHSVQESFGFTNMDRQFALATLVIDRDGMIRFRKVLRQGDSDYPSVQSVLRALQDSDR